MTLGVLFGVCTPLELAAYLGLVLSGEAVARVHPERVIARAFADRDSRRLES